MRLKMCGAAWFIVFSWTLLASPAASGQTTTTGAIVGTVRDATGAVLPGVTVEVSSPALIEKVRTAVTDSQGLYRIVDLRPGEYIVTFTLAGFTGVKREGIQLSAAFAATINAELQVGSLQETVTVSGASPLVDIQSTTQRRTIDTQLIEGLPTTRSFVQLGALVPAVRIGSPSTGNLGSYQSEVAPALTVHGSAANDVTLNVEGMGTQPVLVNGGGNRGGYNVNPAMVEEYSMTSADTAEASSSGVQINIITKQGSNRFTGFFFGQFGNDAMQSNNLDDDLRARGAPTASVMKKVYDINPAFGGPLRRDKVWFFASYRRWGWSELAPGAYHDTDPADWVYIPDLTRPAGFSSRDWAANLRLTLQTSRNSKLAIYGDHVDRYNAGTRSALVAPEASNFRRSETRLYQAAWNWTATDKLLVEAGQTYRPEWQNISAPLSVPRDQWGVIEQRTGVRYRGPSGPQGEHYNWQTNGKFAVAYVTGAHALKVGSQWLWGDVERWDKAHSDIWYTFLGGVPQSVTFRTTPTRATMNVKANLGVYVQEQWRLKRLTLNGGMRFDYLNAYIPPQRLPAVQYAGPRNVPSRIENLPNWKDVSPRLGAAYDLFGTGKTALKWSWGRYVETMGTAIAEAVHPMWQTDYLNVAQGGQASTRAWVDRNGDFIAQEQELGPHSNANFGNVDWVAVRYAPGTVEGWGTRGANWETMAGLQHELLPGLAVDVSYHRRTSENFDVFGLLGAQTSNRLVDNALVTPADYDPFCVTVPGDPRLPGGGGSQMCGPYDIRPSKFGLRDEVVTLAKGYGKQSAVYDGVDLVLNARLPGSLTLQGGTNTGRLKQNRCFVVDSPQQLLYCDIRPPFQTQIKFAAVYPLPWWDVQLSAAFQSYPGPEILATWAAPVALIQPSLGRPLAGGIRSVSIPLVKPGTMYGERSNQLDARIAKIFRVGQVRLQGSVDIYNMLNANPVTRLNNVYGPAWQRPLEILGGRMLKLGFQLNFGT